MEAAAIEVTSASPDTTASQSQPQSQSPQSQPKPKQRQTLALPLCFRIPLSLSLSLSFTAAEALASAQTSTPSFVALALRQPLAAGIGLVASVGALGAVLVLSRTGSLSLVSAGLVFAVKWWLITVGQLVVYRLAIRPLRWVMRMSGSIDRGPAPTLTLTAAP
mgnify:CR=1 FL=1